jgi:hypothetical protein
MAKRSFSAISVKLREYCTRDFLIPKYVVIVPFQWLSTGMVMVGMIGMPETEDFWGL